MRKLNEKREGALMALMLHLRLRDFIRAEDDPARENNGQLSGWGYSEDMRDDEAFALNRWDWLLNKKRAPGFAIFSFDDRVRFAAKITGIEDIPGSRRREIRGYALEGSDLIYTRYVNKPVPERARTGRNPVRYFDDPAEGV
jgi:hypothetical protein